IKSGTVDVVDMVDLERSLMGRPANSEIPLTVLRQGVEVDLSLRLSALNGQNQPVRQPASAPASGPSIVDKTWQILGLKLAASDTSFPIPGQPYKGGM